MNLAEKSKLTEIIATLQEGTEMARKNIAYLDELHAAAITAIAKCPHVCSMPCPSHSRQVAALREVLGRRP